MLIDNFLDIDIRNDKGGLFENFYILERLIGRYRKKHTRETKQYNIVTH